MWKNKKVLIAGGQGFIGYNLALKLLSLGAKVTITEHKNKYDSGDWSEYNDGAFNIIPADLTTALCCSQVTIGQDVVFMCAAVTHGAKFMQENPLVLVTPNVIMNALMLEASHGNKVDKFIFISSSAAYPDTGSIPTKEEMMFKDDPYEKYYPVGWMKRYSEILCETYATKIKNTMKTYVIRPSNLFGPYDDFDPGTSHVTAALIKKVADHMNPLEVWGDGDDVRDILYIDDFVNMVLTWVDNNESFTPINIAYGEAYSVKQILEFLCKIENFCPKIIYNSNMPSMIPVRKIDTTLAKSFGIEPKFHIMGALGNTMEWYKKEY